MKAIRIVSGLGALAMTVVLIYGFTAGNFSEDGALILANPWGIVSLVDLYVGFALFSVWIVFREKNVILAVTLVVLMMVFGFLTGAVYLFVASITSKDALELLAGSKKDAILKKHMEERG
jgi:hypothetical protein